MKYVCSHHFRSYQHNTEQRNSIPFTYAITAPYKQLIICSIQIEVLLLLVSTELNSRHAVSITQ